MNVVEVVVRSGTMDTVILKIIKIVVVVDVNVVMIIKKKRNKTPSRRILIDKIRSEMGEFYLKKSIILVKVLSILLYYRTIF